VASADELKTEFDEARKRLLRAVQHVSEEQFRRRPPASDADLEPWCIGEVLAHLLATERRWAGRIELALREAGTAIEPTAPDVAQEEARVGRRAPAPMLIHGLMASQRRLEALIDRTAAEDGWQRVLVHPVRGRGDIAWMIDTYTAKHTLEHAAQIEALREWLGIAPAGVQA
jgi:uncharacterized damage-inducible protein DinB